MNNKDIVEMGKKYIINNYAQQPFCLVEGKGALVKDADGKEYLDFIAGIAVNSLGHCHPKVSEAIKMQADKLVHCSNLYWIEPQVKLAKILVENSCLDKAFFCNSGAEANEAAIKLARKYGASKGNKSKYEIITMDNSFHGRTLATLAATGQDRLHKDFLPLVEGFKYAPFNDISALEEKINENTCAIMLEPVQGEGGVVLVDKEYLIAVRELCDKNDILLIFDEIQCGIGRTGKLFAYEQLGVEPDIISLAKALGNGVPIGAVLAKKEVGDIFVPGDHGTTFGGNPLVTAAALATLETILEEDILQNVVEVGQYFKTKLLGLKDKYKFIKELRGIGLMVGLGLDMKGADIVKECLEEGLIINCTQENILRFLPPLTITKEDVDKAMVILEKVLDKVQV